MKLGFGKAWLLGAAGAALVVGVLIGLVVNLNPSSSPSNTPLTIDEIIIGIPDSLPTEGKAWNATSLLVQKRSYTTADPLAVRVVSQLPPERTFELTVRLLEEDGRVRTLMPASFTATGGTSGHCCWTIPEAGKYKLQIFAFNQAPFIVPITIIAAPKNVSPLKLKQ
jgi:hypothetical protein